MCRDVTAALQEQPFLTQRLAGRHGLDVIVPPDDTRREIHRIIYDELCAGVVSDASRAIYVDAIDALAREGAQAVILGCTEITLLIKPEHSSLPLLDTTALHAQAAVDFALS